MRPTSFAESVWKINTPLEGIDYLANSFLSLQFSPRGRWILMGIASFASCVCVVMGRAFNVGLSGGSPAIVLGDCISFVSMCPLLLALIMAVLELVL